MPYSKGLHYQAYHHEDRSRTPLVLIHGAGGDYLSWPSQIRRLAGFRVYTPDLPGHGKSKGPGMQRIARYGERIQEWIQDLGLSRAYIAGHSMGGAIGLWLGIQHPDLVQGLILISTGASLPVNLSLIDSLANPQGFPAAVEQIIKWSFSPGTDTGMMENVKSSMLKTRPSVLAADFRACDAFDLSGELEKVQPPSLILVGEEDRMTPLRFSEELHERIPGSDLRVIIGAGHMLPLEQPGNVMKALREFIDRVQEG
jgi:pimeloyl-ACP methyl ester carboxylesterase